MLDEQLVSIDILPLLESEIFRIQLRQLQRLVPRLPVCVSEPRMRVTIVQLPSGALSYALNGSWWLIIFLRQRSEVVLPKTEPISLHIQLAKPPALHAGSLYRFECYVSRGE